jgi:glyoxylase-like metal-dependent hydrolase (beta-lactamase superfamily II)
MASNFLSLRIPKGSETCRLSIINTTCDLTVPPYYLVEPEIKGHEWLNLPTYSFHIKHDNNGKDLISGHVPGLKVTKDVIDILPEGNVNINNVEALVLSHWHFDHCGAPSALPRSVNMIVGPKFKETFLPGFPLKEDSPFHEADFEGRQVFEVPFSDNLKIGQFQAHDYFGDGSFYILNVPGHAIGHISGLVRTTPGTFVFLGGDVCHITGTLRPTQYIPMPDQIPDETALDRCIPRPCPCSAFLSSHPDQSNSRTVRVK